MIVTKHLTIAIMELNGMQMRNGWKEIIGICGQHKIIVLTSTLFKKYEMKQVMAKLRRVINAKLSNGKQIKPTKNRKDISYKGTIVFIHYIVFNVHI